MKHLFRKVFDILIAIFAIVVAFMIGRLFGYFEASFDLSKHLEKRKKEKVESGEVHKSERGRASEHRPLNQISFSSYAQADNCLQSLRNSLMLFGRASVGDLYDFANVQPKYMDQLYGWKTLSEAFIYSDGDTFKINLPPAERLIEYRSDLPKNMEDTIPQSPRTSRYGDFYHRRSKSKINVEERANYYDFKDVVFKQYENANKVLSNLKEKIENGDPYVKVSDFYELVGKGSAPLDHKYGWTDLDGVLILSSPNGYVLDFPTPIFVE